MLASLKFSYHTFTTKGVKIIVNNPSDMPEETHVDRIEEPYISAQIITKSEYIGAVINLCIDKRGILKNKLELIQITVKYH